MAFVYNGLVVCTLPHNSDLYLHCDDLHITTLLTSLGLRIYIVSAQSCLVITPSVFQKYSLQTPHNLPVTIRYKMSFVRSRSDLCGFYPCYGICVLVAQCKAAVIPLLTHWGRVTHICVSKLTIIGSDNGLLPGWCQAIISANAGILLIQTLGTNFSEILSEILTFSFKKMHLKMLSAKWWQFPLGLSVLTRLSYWSLVVKPLVCDILLYWTLAVSIYYIL